MRSWRREAASPNSYSHHQARTNDYSRRRSSSLSESRIRQVLWDKSRGTGGHPGPVTRTSWSNSKDRTVSRDYRSSSTASIDSLKRRECHASLFSLSEGKGGRQLQIF